MKERVNTSLATTRLCSLASPFESYLISNSEIRFSRDKVQFSPDLLIKVNIYISLTQRFNCINLQINIQYNNYNMAFSYMNYTQYEDRSKGSRPHQEIQ